MGYSSHSVQYADGAVGPMTLHGPTSAEWDEAISPPLIMTDWGHNTAFQAVTKRLLYPDILLNGKGNVTNFNSSIPNTTTIESPYHITFQTPQKGHRITRYLLRLINTSFGSTFIFSIDNHRLQIISTDFVPIQPYYNTSVTVGIGQRYHVIVEANPLVYNETSPLPADGNYWMRTFVAPCGMPRNKTENYERTGILRYNKSSKAIPSSHKWPNIATECADEKYQTLFPILQWQVKDPRSAKDPSSAKSYRKDYDLWSESSYPDMPYPLAKWSLEEEKVFMSMRVNYSDPTFLLLDNKDGWDPLRRIVVENFTSKDWVS